MWKVIAALGVIVIAALGCKTGNKTQVDPITGEAVPIQEQVLAASAAQRFSDVPLPVETKVDTERSFVYESGTVQIGRMVYTLRQPVNAVAQFYVREAPQYGWILDSVLEADGTQLLMHKSDKKMIVTVSDVGYIKGGTRLIIQLIPEDASVTTSDLAPMR